MKPRYIALLPFFIFLAVFTILNIIYSDASISKDNFPIFAAIVALISSFFTFQKHETLQEKIELFIQGSSQSIVIHMCYIFFLSTVFTTILEQTGGIASAVAICLHFIPSWCILPGMFLVSSLFSFTVGTSMGAIAAFMPIATTISNHIHCNPSLMAATIVCGAMFGDNLSILSDTTITAVKVTGTTMAKKFVLNIKIALPAFIASLVMLTYQNHLIASSSHIAQATPLNFLDCIKIVPYLITFYLALIGFDIIIVMMCGITMALALGIFLKTISALQAINLLFDGFYNSKGMVNVFILVLLLSALSNIITHNGGLEYIIEKLKHKISNPRHAKFAIFCLVGLVNITIAINTIAIIVSGPVAKKIGDDYNIDPAETACILDIGSCLLQGLLPYTPQILLAASMAQVSTISLLPYLYYQLFLGASLLITMTLKNK